MKKVLLPAGLVALSACSPSNPANTFFYSEAGAILDAEADFGNSTMNNTQLMTGQRNAVIDLAKRFAAEVDSTVNFAFDSATLDAQAQAVLREQANFIRQFPELRFRVYGHTDLVGPASYNKSLGLRRARAVVHFLASQGINRDRLEAVASFGETQPLVVTQGRERRNRRTVTEVSGFYERHPSVMDGKYARVIYRDYIASATARTGLSGISGSEFGTEQ